MPPDDVTRRVDVSTVAGLVPYLGEERWLALLEPFSAVVFGVLDDESRVVRTNRGFDALLGRGDGTSPDERLASRFVQPTFADLRDAEPDEKAATFRGILTVLDERGRSHSVNGVALRFDTVVIVLAEHDVAEYRTMFEEMLELNEELSQTHRELIRAQRELKRQRDLLEHESTTDELTGLRNRRFLMERMGDEIARAERRDVPLTVVTFDIDTFKAVNDTFGHAAGDDALKAVADVFRTESRAYDVVGRMGGDEFIAVLPDTALGDAVALAERLGAGVRDVELSSVPPGLTASFGVAARRSGDDLHGLLRRADRALYRAKRAGRNRVHAFAGEDDAEADT